MQVGGAENPGQEAFRLSFDKVHNYEVVDAPPLDPHKCKTIELKGPHSPLEMKVYGVTQSAGDKTVEIEGSSVNTVLLDSQPETYSTR